MNRKSKDIKSLNDSLLGELSIEELENRLKMEKLNRTEMWGCDCDDKVRVRKCPDNYCPYSVYG